MVGLTGLSQIQDFFKNFLFSGCRGKSWGGGKGGVTCCSGRGRVSFWCSHCVTCQREIALEFILRTSLIFAVALFQVFLEATGHVRSYLIVTPCWAWCWWPGCQRRHHNMTVPKPMQCQDGRSTRSTHDPSARPVLEPSALPRNSTIHIASRSGLDVEIRNQRECLTVRRPVRPCNAREVQNQLWVKGISNGSRTNSRLKTCECVEVKSRTGF